MLDRDDEQIIKEAKEGGCVFVTWDRVVRLATGGITPYEALDQAKAEGKGTKEAQAEVSRLRKLKPGELTSLSDAANKTYELFRQHITVGTVEAKLIRLLRVEQNYSWRAVARRCSDIWHAPWGGNQLAGMAICRRAAEIEGEDFMKPPWN